VKGGEKVNGIVLLYESRGEVLISVLLAYRWIYQ